MNAHSAIDPHNTEALNNLSHQWELEDREAAVETFQTVLCIKPGDPDALSNLSDAVSAGAKEVVLLPEIKIFLRNTGHILRCQVDRLGL